MTTDALKRIFDSDRTMREAEGQLLSQEQAVVVSELSKAVTEAKAMEDRAEACMRLERLADLCAQVPGPEMADALINILDDEEPTVRSAAGEALLDVTYTFYAEVARAIDRALDEKRTGPVMSELPFLLAEVGEPGAAKQLKRFLQSDSAEVIAAAIEASVELLDPQMIEPIEKLTDDEREVVFFDFEAATQVSIAELATAAVEALSNLEAE